MRLALAFALLCSPALSAEPVEAPPPPKMLIVAPLVQHRSAVFYRTPRGYLPQWHTDEAGVTWDLHKPTGGYLRRDYRLFFQLL